MDAVRQKEQRLGYGVPERAHRVERKAVSDRSANLLWSGARLSRGTCETENSAEIRQGRKELEGDDLRCIWRKSDQGHSTEGRLDVPSRWHRRPTPSDISTGRHDQRHGGGGLFLAKTTRDGN